MSENTEPKMSSLLVAIAAADAILTTFERINAIILARQKEVGELTDEEDAALEAYEERRFSAWKTAPVRPDDAG